MVIFEYELKRWGTERRVENEEEEEKVVTAVDCQTVRKSDSLFLLFPLLVVVVVVLAVLLGQM